LKIKQPKARNKKRAFFLDLKKKKKKSTIQRFNFKKMKQFPYEETFLKKLIQVSQAFNKVQKKYLLEKLNTYSEEKKQKLFQILTKEQMKQYEGNKKRVALNNDFLNKKTKIINKYNEKLENINNQNVLNELDNELALISL